MGLFKVLLQSEVISYMLVYVTNPAYSADVLERLLRNVTCRLRSFVSARFAAKAVRRLQMLQYSQFSTLHHFILSSEINLAFIPSSRGCTPHATGKSGNRLSDRYSIFNSFIGYIVWYINDSILFCWGLLSVYYSGPFPTKDLFHRNHKLTTIHWASDDSWGYFGMIPGRLLPSAACVAVVSPCHDAMLRQRPCVRQGSRWGPRWSCLVQGKTVQLFFFPDVFSLCRLFGSNADWTFVGSVTWD